MKNLLDEEQKNYLKSLDSKKKRRKFMLDCLVESVIGESAKIDTSKVVVFKDGVFKTSDPEMICAMNAWVDKTELFTSTTAPRTFEGLGIPNLIKKKMEGCKRIGDRFFKEKHVFKNNDLVFITDTNRVVKSGYVKNATTHDEFGVIVDGDWEPLHIDNLTVCNFSPFAQAEKKDELLKFDMLKDKPLEYVIKDKLLERGFTNENITNNRGLIGATIDETVNEVKKCYESVDKKEGINTDSLYDDYLLDVENHLCWIYNRLISAHGENPNFDYMHKLYEIAVGYNPEYMLTKKYQEKVAEKIINKNYESANSEKKQKSVEQQAFDMIYPEKKYTEEDMRKCFNYSRTFKITSAESYQVNSLLKYTVFRNFEDYKKQLKND